MSHIDALELRIFHERRYIRAAKSDQEAQLRQVWVDQLKKEIAVERSAFPDQNVEDVEMSDGEILSALFES